MLTIFKIFIYLLFSLSALLLSGCGGGDGEDSPPSLPPSYSETHFSTALYNGAHVRTSSTNSDDVIISYDLDLGSGSKDVYFVFTNNSQSDTTEPPSVSSNIHPPYEQHLASSSLAEALDVDAKQNGLGLMGRPDISLFNSNPRLYSGQHLEVQPGSSLYNAALASALPVSDALGDTATFYPGNDTANTVSAICRKVVTANNKTLNIWVSDNTWDTGCVKSRCVSQSMVDVMADKFLLAGDNNDTYEWLTNIFGAEWGPHTSEEQISADNNITILLFDINDDDSTNGGELGFFYAKDNFLRSSYTGSNQRLMFYMDSVLFASEEGDSWDITDHWPEIIISTLVHEFQHMIHYYQKNVLLGSSTEVWLNEMCSMVAEDLLARKLHIDGPRGVLYSDGTAGQATNTSGYLPRYNRFNYIPVSQWLSGPETSHGDNNILNSYASNYSFGAFLARNFGGANLFRNIVHSSTGDYTAVDAGLIATGFSGETFTSTMEKWGIAVLLSNNASTTEVPDGYRFNSGDFTTTTIGSISYDLGSINMYNYLFRDGGASQSGPRIYSTLPPSDVNAGTYKTSNMFYQLGSNLSGTITTQITLKAGMGFSVLVK